MVLPKLKILKFYGCYVLRGVFVTQFQGLNVCFDDRDWRRDRSDVGLRSGVCGLESICGANVLGMGGGLVMLAGTGVNLLKEMASTSMEFGLRGGEFLDVKKDAFPFLPLMAAMHIFCTWKVLTILIHSFNVVETVNMERIMVAICWLIPRKK